MTELTRKQQYINEIVEKTIVFLKKEFCTPLTETDKFNNNDKNNIYMSVISSIAGTLLSHITCEDVRDKMVVRICYTLMTYFHSFIVEGKAEIIGKINLKDEDDE